MLNLHPSAKENFDRKAEALQSLLRETPKKPPTSSSFLAFPNEIHIKKLKDFSIINTATVDNRGKTIGRHFEHNGAEVSLVDHDYTKLVFLAESIQCLPQIRDKLSQQFIEEAIFTWLEKKYKKEHKGVLFTDSLEALAAEQVQPITTYVPITKTIVEIPLEFCGVTIENISKENIDKLFPPLDLVDAKQKDFILKYSKDLQEEYRGYAAVKIDLECEPKYAAKISTEKAKRVADLLGIYSDATFTPDIQSFSRIKGDKSAATSSTIFLFSEKNSQISGYNLSQPMNILWQISKSDIERFKKWGLDIHSEIETKENPSELEKTVSTFGRLYSKVALTPDPIEKLIYALSAIESTLLKNDTESIQQNLAERMAFLLETELNKRKNVIKNVKNVYQIRSRYLHHGLPSDDISQLSYFLINVLNLFFNLLSLTKKFQTKKELLDAIEDHKLS